MFKSIVASVTSSERSTLPGCRETEEGQWYMQLEEGSPEVSNM